FEQAIVWARSHGAARSEQAARHCICREILGVVSGLSSHRPALSEIRTITGQTDRPGLASGGPGGRRGSRGGGRGGGAGRGGGGGGRGEERAWRAAGLANGGGPDQRERRGQGASEAAWGDSQVESRWATLVPCPASKFAQPDPGLDSVSSSLRQPAGSSELG